MFKSALGSQDQLFHPVTTEVINKIVTCLIYQSDELCFLTLCLCSTRFHQLLFRQGHPLGVQGLHSKAIAEDLGVLPRSEVDVDLAVLLRQVSRRYHLLLFDVKANFIVEHQHLPSTDSRLGDVIALHPGLRFTVSDPSLVLGLNLEFD